MTVETARQYNYPFSTKDLTAETPIFKGVNQEALTASLEQAAHLGPVVEIGGFTRDGYASMQGVTFKDPCIIVNLPPSKNPPCASPIRPLLEKQGQRAHFVYADGRALPFADNSVGIVLMSAVPLLTTEVQDAVDRSPEGIVQPALGRQACTTTYYNELADKLEATRRDPDGVISHLSPRLGSMVAASRVLTPDGILVMRLGLSQRELAVADALGFTLLAATPQFSQKHKCSTDEHTHIRRGSKEIVLQKRVGA